MQPAELLSNPAPAIPCSFHSTSALVATPRFFLADTHLRVLIPRVSRVVDIVQGRLETGVSRHAHSHHDCPAQVDCTAAHSTPVYRRPGAQPRAAASRREARGVIKRHHLPESCAPRPPCHRSRHQASMHVGYRSKGCSTPRVSVALRPLLWLSFAEGRPQSRLVAVQTPKPDFLRSAVKAIARLDSRSSFLARVIAACWF